VNPFLEGDSLDAFPCGLEGVGTAGTRDTAASKSQLLVFYFPEHLSQLSRVLMVSSPAKPSHRLSGKINPIQPEALNCFKG